jgi:peptidoglycan/xylan/chitin deacetylase (PgdA/CDA1 family)
MIRTAFQSMPTAAPRFAAARPNWHSTLEEFAMRLVGRASSIPHALLGSRAGEALGILNYHRVADPVAGVPRPLHNVPPPRFAEQISGLIRGGWSVWPLRQVLQCRRRGHQPPRRVFVITFDDGFESVYHQAWPVLRRLEAPFTLFVNTQYLDSAQPFPFDVWGMDHAACVPPETYRPLTSAQCRKMADSGLMELGAHTHSHEDFRGRPEAFRQDLELCVEALRAQFGVDEVPFAFPYGSPRRGFASPDLTAAAREVGVICALTTRAMLVDLRSDPFSWGRFTAFDWDTSTTLAAKLGGWYSWAGRLRSWCSRLSEQATA